MSSEKLVVEKTLKKSQEVLKIRKHHGLKYNDILLPVIANLTDGYHTSCYKNFIALMKKYIENTVIESNVSTLTKDNLLSDNSYPAEPSTTLQPSTSTVEPATLEPQPSISPLQPCTSILNEDTLDFHLGFDGECMPQLVFDAVVHEENKNNDDENHTTDDEEVAKSDTDESEDSSSSDEESTDEE